MKKVSNNKIAQHQFNFKTVYNKPRTSSHVTQTSCSWSHSLCASTVASLHVVAYPLLPERQHSSFKAAPADAFKLISIAEWRDPVADTGDHPRRCCLQRFRTETAGGVCTPCYESKETCVWAVSAVCTLSAVSALHTFGKRVRDRKVYYKTTTKRGKRWLW